MVENLLDERLTVCDWQVFSCIQRLFEVVTELVNKFESSIKYLAIMDNIFNPSYRRDYLAGYSSAFNPHLEYNRALFSEAYNSGFNLGRLEYEDMNGYIRNGIPLRILTRRILEEFMLAGILGMGVDTRGYNAYQIEIIDRWYQSGIEKYEPDFGFYLQDVLEERGIEMSE